MSGRHVADAEAGFRVVNINPDFCRVCGKVVPFDIYREMPPERRNYASTVRARGAKILKVDSIISGVIGNAGQGVMSGVSQSSGDFWMTQVEPTVQTEGKHTVRHNEPVQMKDNS